MANRFIVEIKGKDFTLTMQGSGDASSARQYLSDLYRECTVEVRGSGAPVDIDSGP
jgi:hypothetical protein